MVMDDNVLSEVSELLKRKGASQLVIHWPERRAGEQVRQVTTTEELLHGEHDEHECWKALNVPGIIENAFDLDYG